ncbi:DUF6035 family protein [Pseudomonas coleopterorum]|uniref:DUF6035 family protein n=1 Tax=Pseudomonas coleopterorum TaxID=1605838 RepID=UPI002A6AB5AC|nr:DUF6035 family protein [Pseudomonas coleopterorum]MDY1045272.1 DUF6035 family protein [Pseudomonas coleopterorum]
MPIADRATWRKPDVQAYREQRRFAFEVQLSTTFLTEIVGRREFYRVNGGAIVWVFEGFNPQENRTAEQDICNRPGKSSSVAGSIVLRDCATMKLSPQCRSGTAGHHHPSQTRSKHFLVLSTIETLEIPFKRCWIT